MATRGYRDLLAALRGRRTARIAPPEQLIGFAHAYVDYAASIPQLFKLMFGPAVQPAEQYPELREASRETFQLVQDILHRGMELGQFRQQDNRLPGQRRLGQHSRPGHPAGGRPRAVRAPYRPAPPGGPGGATFLAGIK